jgi:hypothetical protein
VIRRSPCEFYIKYLIVGGHNNSSIRSLLEAIELDYVSDSYVEGLRDQLHPPEPFYPRDLRHRASRDFLVREGLYDMFLFDPDVRRAFDILESARAKEFIETMLLVYGPPLAIAQGLSVRYGISGCDIQTVQKYGHYFFNIGLVDSTEIRALLRLRLENVSNSPDPLVKAQYSALLHASYTDARRTAAALPHSPLSALIAQIQMGFAPKDIDIRKIMDMSENMTHLRLAEALMSNSKDFDRKAFNLATTARILQEIRESKIKPEEELRQQLESVSMKTEAGPVMMVHDLTKGRHTVDLAALPASKEEHGKPQKDR